MSLHGAILPNLRQSILQKAAWQSCPAACKFGTGEDKEGNKRRTAEILAENIYFGDSKKEDDGGSAAAPTQGFGAPAQSGGFTPNFGSAQPGSFVPNFGGNY